MITYEFFYDIANYINTQEKQLFSPKEVACSAYEYLCEFNMSFKNQEPTEVIKTLCSILVDYGSLEWAYDIAKELNLIDMDFMDYLETDTAIIKKFIDQGDNANERIH